MNTDAINLEVLPPNDPVKKLKESIEEASRELAACHGNIEEIKNRNFFQNIFSRSSKDMTDLASGHLTAMNVMFRLIQNGIDLDAYNAESLLRLRKELEDSERRFQGSAKSYISMARSYVERACGAHVAFGDRVAVLEKCLFKESNSRIENLDVINQWLQYLELNRKHLSERADALAGKLLSLDQRLQQYISTNSQRQAETSEAFDRALEDKISALHETIGEMVSSQLEKYEVESSGRASRNTLLVVTCICVSCLALISALVTAGIVFFKH